MYNNYGCVIETDTNEAHLIKHRNKNHFVDTVCGTFVDPRIKTTDFKDLPEGTSFCKKCVANMYAELLYYEKRVKKLTPIASSFRSMFENCREHNPVNKGRVRSVRECGAFDFISRNPEEVVIYLNKALDALDIKNREPRHHVKCLDVGCGAGNIMALMKEIIGRRTGGWCVIHGIEFDRYYAELAKNLVTRKGGDWVEVFCQDAFSFENYGEYDIIYYWCPIEDRPKQKKLEKLIEDNMKKGAVLIPLLKRDMRITTNDDFKSIKVYESNDCIYKKVR